MLIERHMTPLQPDKKQLRRWLGRLGAEGVRQLLALQEADMRGKGIDCPEELSQLARLQQLVEEVLSENACLRIQDLAINGTDLIAAGIPPGPALGKLLNTLLEQVQDERLPNTKAALLAACKEELI